MAKKHGLQTKPPLLMRILSITWKFICRTVAAQAVARLNDTILFGWVVVFLYLCFSLARALPFIVSKRVHFLLFSFLYTNYFQFISKAFYGSAFIHHLIWFCEKIISNFYLSAWEKEIGNERKYSHVSDENDPMRKFSHFQVEYAVDLRSLNKLKQKLIRYFSLYFLIIKKKCWKFRCAARTHTHSNTTTAAATVNIYAETHL